MTVGTLITCILALLYVLWSFYAIKDFKEEGGSWVSYLWIIVTCVVGVIMVPYLIANWNKELFKFK